LPGGVDFRPVFLYIVPMIKIEKNENISGWLNIFVAGFLVEQVKGRAKALRIAGKLAKERKEIGFSFLGFPMIAGETEKD